MARQARRLGIQWLFQTDTVISLILALATALSLQGWHATMSVILVFMLLETLLVAFIMAREAEAGTQQAEKVKSTQPPSAPRIQSATFQREKTERRRAERQAGLCAVVAQYARPPLRMAALRCSSREIGDRARSSRRAIVRTPHP